MFYISVSLPIFLGDAAVILAESWGANHVLMIELILLKEYIYQTKYVLYSLRKLRHYLKILWKYQKRLHLEIFFKRFPIKYILLDNVNF